MNSGQACWPCKGSCSLRGYFGDLPGDEIVVSPPSPIVEPLRTRLYMTHRLHTSVTMSFFSGIHRRLSHSGRHHRSLWTLSNIIALNSSLWPRKLAYLAMTRRSQPSLLPMTPESRNASAVKCVTLTTIYDKHNAKTSYYMATLRNSPKTRRCDLPLLEPVTAASLKPALSIICGASA